MLHLTEQNEENLHLFYIRHGERADHAKHLNIEYPVKTDPPLTPLGVQQATETGYFFKKYLTTHKFDEVKIECSPYIRTMMTGAAIARVLEIPVLTINHGFCEWMSEMFFDENILPKLMTRTTPRDVIVRDYLEGVEYVDEDIGFEEAMSYYPES